MEVGRLARWYRWIEYAAFGRALECARFAFLHRLAGAHRVLVLGEGDGRTLKRLLAIAPQAYIDVIESSTEMIALARARIGDTARVRFHCEDALAASFPKASYDGVVTCFFLDCFTESQLRDLLQRVQPALKPGSIWLLSEFAIPARGWQRWHSKIWIAVMYRFFRVTTGLRANTMPPIERSLSEFRMRRLDIWRQRGGMIVSEVFEYQPAGVRNPRSGQPLFP